MFLRFFQVATNINSSFILLLKHSFQSHKSNHLWFIQSLLDGHWDCSQFGAVPQDAVRDIHVLAQVHVDTSVEQKCRNGIAGLDDN